MARKQRKGWKDMTPQQRAGSFITLVVQLTLLILALRDLRSRPASQINGNKKLWFGLVFINFFGPIAYFTIGRKRTA